MYERIQPIQQSSKTQSYIASRYSQHRTGGDIYMDRSPEHAPICGHNETTKEKEKKKKEEEQEIRKGKTLDYLYVFRKSHRIAHSTIFTPRLRACLLTSLFLVSSER
jgi:5-methylcytosine-specific restriction endonuclease McrA